MKKKINIRYALKVLLILIAIIVCGTIYLLAHNGHNTSKEAEKLIHALADNHIFGAVEYLFMSRLIVAFVLGCIAGITHSFSKTSTVTISLKTYGAVALGSAMFSCIYTHLHFNTGSANPLQNLGSITTGIGFLCAAVIFKGETFIRGLSTAATIWTTASIGTACGCGLFGLAIMGTFIISIFHMLPSAGSHVEVQKPD
jgi:uncharacterized membrane protein YhiD involved in acid resistance